MLRFQLQTKPDASSGRPLAGAHLVGPDEKSVPADIKFADGIVECRRRGRDAMALALQYDARSAGTLMLQTCLLPDRPEPYCLATELARYQIKTFIAKSEEWQAFDHPRSADAVRIWEQARETFTRSITTRDQQEAASLANESLIAALDANEKLALAHAEILLHRRFGTRAASRLTLGVRVWPGRDGKPLREFIGTNFDLVHLPLRWREIEVEEGKFKWGPIDRWVEWASSQGKPIIAGPLLDFSARSLPPWMEVWKHDYDTCRDLTYDFMERVVGRYASSVAMWNLATGINTNDNFHFSPGEMYDLVRTARLLVRQYRKGARAMIEIRHPFGEFAARNKDAVHPIPFVTQLLQEGVHIDALGLQLIFGEGSGHHVRDLMQISNLFDRFHLLEIPVLVSALGAPSVPRTDGKPSVGFWHDEWSPRTQERWVNRVFPLVLSKPAVESVFWTDLYDHAAADVPGTGLLDEAGKPKPALRALIGLRRRLRRPLGTGGLASAPGIADMTPSRSTERSRPAPDA